MNTKISYRTSVFGLSGLLANWLCGAIMIFAAPGAVAQDAPSYQLELLIFRHNSPATGGETWGSREPITFSDVPDVELEVDPIEAMPLGNFERLAAEEYALQEAAAKLGKASRFTMLVHTGWIQPAVSLEESVAKNVAGSDGSATVNGKVVLSRGRYLHLDFDLKLATANGEFRLKQRRRRVQTRKYHYIDHPHFSAVVLITPL